MRFVAFLAVLVGTAVIGSVSLPIGVLGAVLWAIVFELVSREGSTTR